MVWKRLNYFILGPYYCTKVLPYGKCYTDANCYSTHCNFYLLKIVLIGDTAGQLKAKVMKLLITVVLVMMIMIVKVDMVI